MSTIAENHFLSSLPSEDRSAVLRRSTPVVLKTGQVLIEQDAAVEMVHFPLDAQLANVIVLGDGGTVETSLIGREGLSGLAPVLADRPCGWRVIVRAGGQAYALRAEAMRDLQASSPALHRRSLELTSFYEAQAAQIGACNASHPMAARLARWLLTAEDLSPGRPLRFTQEEVAALLGTQRTTVNEAARTLKVDKTIGYARGVIKILDRPRLSVRACECYRAVRGRAERLGLYPDNPADR